MDQKQIEEIVRSVMASMGQAAPAPSEAKCATTNCAAPVTSESCALDLGSAEAKAWIGVENPHRADVLTELRRSTVARVCTGRAGPRPRTRALLRFPADHSFERYRTERSTGRVGESAGLAGSPLRNQRQKSLSDSPGYGPPPVCRSC